MIGSLVKFGFISCCVGTGVEKTKTEKKKTLQILKLEKLKTLIKLKTGK